MNYKFLTRMAVLLVVVAWVAPAHAHEAVFVTADNGAGTNLFGTLDLKTGRFTQIAQTTPLFYALTAGPEGRLYGADLDTGTLFTISKAGVTTPYGSITAPGFQYIAKGAFGFLGLTYRGRDDRFLAVNVDPQHVTLQEIGRHARKVTDLGIIEGPDTGTYYSGSLAKGPHGRLYFDFVPPSGPQLYTVDESSGAPTPVGSGLGTDILTLFSDGTTLYGIDTNATSAIGIYIVNVKTGVAVATGVTVKGLPKSKDFYVDTATFDPLDHERCE